MKKADIIAKLTELGIEFDENAKASELGALLPAESKKVQMVAVLSKLGAKVREYSLEVHGKEFVELAEGYAGKIGGSVEKVK